MLRRWLLFFLVLELTGAWALAGDEAAAWLRAAAAARLPAYGPKVPAAVLLTERSIKVDEDGRVTAIERYAVRLLSSEGRHAARAVTSYLADTGKVRDMRVWVIRPSGQIKAYGKDRVLDIAAAPNDVFNEVRIRMIDASNDIEPGAIFGAEWTTEDRSVFMQFDWHFQERYPTLVSRCSLTLPPGWRAESVTFNHAKVEPVISGSTYTWELHDLLPIEKEPSSPPVTGLAPRLGVSYFPPPGGRTRVGRTFDTWASVSAWLSELSDPQTVLTEALAAKARELTTGATTELERIQAIGRYVQGVNYISIQTGVGRGGGYRPHSAVDVFTKSYGDCKDKANLMRTLLKAVGIVGYMVTIYSGDPTYVRAEWPSPQQFNHVILAVKVSEAAPAAPVVTHPTLGRLLVFDPTDENTPVGDLPGHEQGSLALVVAGGAGALLRMPTLPPEANQLERQAEVTLGPDGSITASIRERSVGQAAAAERQYWRARPHSEYVKMIETWVTGGATGARVMKVVPLDRPTEGQFALDVEFSAERYGQLTQGRLMLFKPAVVARRESVFPTAATRRHPVILRPQAYSETARIKLPSGFAVDELPDPVTLDTPFGAYRTAYNVADGHLVFTRSLLVRASTIPSAEYETVRGFYEKMRAAEQAPVVLVKKSKP